MTLMHRAFAFVFILSLAGPAWALDQRFLDPVLPIDSSLKGMGGVSTANAQGWSALFINPAAFADPTPSATITALGVTGYMPLSGINQILAAHASWGVPDYSNPSDPMTSLINSLLTNYGLGGELTLGGGWVGKNFGAGLMLETRSFAKGTTLLGTQDTIEESIEAVLGGAIPIDVGLGTIKVGASVRPQQKALTTVAATDLLDALGGDTSAVMNSTVNAGFGLGWDFGARWDYAGFKTGLVLRDLGSTLYNFQEYTISDWISTVGFSPNGNTSSTTNYRVPMTIAVGSSWSPDLGALAAVIQPTVAVDLQIPLKDQYTQSSFWTWTHVGAEAKFLRFLAVRAGLNEGYFTFGMGVSAPYVDFNFAIYADEMGRYAGVNRRSSVSMDWTFHL
jgi:hypothetical protein